MDPKECTEAETALSRAMCFAAEAMAYDRVLKEIANMLAGAELDDLVRGDHDNPARTALERLERAVRRYYERASEATERFRGDAMHHLQTAHEKVLEEIRSRTTLALNSKEMHERVKRLREVYIGRTIRIISMAGEPQYDGKTGECTSVDDSGQLHGEWGGLAIQPERDNFILVGV